VLKLDVAPHAGQLHGPGGVLDGLFGVQQLEHAGARGRGPLQALVDRGQRVHGAVQLPPVAAVGHQPADGERAPHDEPGAEADHDDAAQKPDELNAGQKSGAGVDGPVLLAEVLGVGGAEAFHGLVLTGKGLDDQVPQQVFLQLRGHVAQAVAHPPVQRLDPPVEDADQQEHHGQRHQRGRADDRVDGQNGGDDHGKPQERAEHLVDALNDGLLHGVDVVHGPGEQVAAAVFMVKGHRLALQLFVHGQAQVDDEALAHLLHEVAVQSRQDGAQKVHADHGAQRGQQHVDPAVERHLVGDEHPHQRMKQRQRNGHHEGAEPDGQLFAVRFQKRDDSPKNGQRSTPNRGGAPHSPYGIQMFLICVACHKNSRPAPCTGSNQSRARPWLTHVRFRLPAEARSTMALPSAVPKYQTASTSSCSASTWTRASRAPVTMLMTPPGTSDVSNTWYRSVAASGCGSDGTTTTVLPMATAGATSETKAKSGRSSGQPMPRTPMGSGTARVTWRPRVRCTAPSYLSAQAAYSNQRSTAASTSAYASLSEQPVMAASRPANSSRRTARFSPT